jgi:hypothetical protein
MTIVFLEISHLSDPSIIYIVPTIATGIMTIKPTSPVKKLTSRQRNQTPPIPSLASIIARNYLPFTYANQALEMCIASY